jgi:catechol 2,3-dioxygenase-like lactoylglutathione lyase family enzyme
MTIFCRDLERSLALYRDILRFEVIEEKTVSGPAMARMVALDDCTVRICHLASQRSENGLIGLYEISGVDVPEAPRARVGRIHYGQTAMVVYTERLAEIYQELKDGGYVFLTPPTAYVRRTQSELKAGNYTEMLFYDPDGVLVSITGLDGG